MKITLRFFASVREMLGAAEDSLELDAASTVGAVTVGEVRAVLAARGGAWAEALGQDRALRMACNHVMCGPDTVVPDGAEVAFFPPVTGG